MVSVLSKRTSNFCNLKRTCKPQVPISPKTKLELFGTTHCLVDKYLHKIARIRWLWRILLICPQSVTYSILQTRSYIYLSSITYRVLEAENQLVKVLLVVLNCPIEGCSFAKGILKQLKPSHVPRCTGICMYQAPVSSLTPRQIVSPKCAKTSSPVLTPTRQPHA